MKPLFAILTAAMITLSGSAQLPDGSIAPDFTATDIDSVEHNLHSYLDSGYQVILYFAATWCGPCWNYHTSGVLEELYEAYGPEGTNEIRVFFIEGDDYTTAADLQGTGPSTAGDWITGTSYPIIDNAGDIFATFENTYFPTIYTVCPSGLITESGQATVVGHEAVLQSATCAPASFPNDGLLVGYAGDGYSCGDNLANLAVRLMNQGLDTLTSCSIQVSRPLPFNQTEVIGTYDWTGSLATYEVTTAELTDLAIDAQTLFNFDIVSDDDNPGNNSTIGEVLKSEEMANNIQIRLFTDMNPEETGWVLANASGDVIVEVDAGTEITQGQTEYIWDVTLPELGCYSLTLMDLAGDGHIGGAFSLDDVGSLTVSSMDGPAGWEQEWFFQTIEEFSEILFEFNASSFSSVNGCTDLEACNYWEGASEDDGSCEYESCAGCMEDGACNYNPGASIADESCDYSCFGCLDPGAWNYAPEATIDDGSCLFFVPTCEFEGSESWLGLETGLFAGLDTLTFEFGVLDSGSLVINLPLVMEEPGTGSLFGVLEWNDLSWAGLPQGMEWSSSLASLEAGHHHCIGLEGTPYEEGLFDLTVSGDLVLQVFGQPYPLGMFAATLPLRIIPNEQGVWGCTYANATNFLAFANVDDGSCSYEGCMDLDANNYQLFATVDDGSCIFDSLDPACPGDVDGDGTVGTGDLLALLSSFGLICQ